MKRSKLRVSAWATALTLACVFAESRFLGVRESGAVRDIRAMGVPTTVADLRLPPYDPAQDVGAILNSALDATQRDPGLTNAIDALYQGRAQDATIADMALAVAAAHRLEPLTEQCRLALERPRWSVALPETWDTSQIDARPAKAYRLLGATAFAKSFSGDTDGAFKDLEIAGRIAERLAQTPNLSALRTALSLQSGAWHTWLLCLKQHALDPKAIDDAERVAKAMPPLPDLRRAIEGEFVYNRLLQEHAQKHSLWKDLPPHDLTARVYLSRPVVRYASARTMDGWKIVFENLPKDSTDWKGVQDALNKGENFVMAGNLTGYSSSILYPAMGQVTAPWVKQLATRRLAAVSLALLRQKSCW